MGDEQLNNLALMCHVSNHGDHVVICCAHKRRTKDDSKVACLHLVCCTVFHHLLQVKQQELKRLKMMIWQFMQL